VTIVAIVLEREGKRIFRHDIVVSKGVGDLPTGVKEALERFRSEFPNVELWEEKNIVQRYLTKEQADAGDNRPTVTRQASKLTGRRGGRFG
jgi:hypothetical protein